MDEEEETELIGIWMAAFNGNYDLFVEWVTKPPCKRNREIDELTLNEAVWWARDGVHEGKEGDHKKIIDWINCRYRVVSSRLS